MAGQKKEIGLVSKWWFWLLVAIAIWTTIGIATSSGNQDNSNNSNNSSSVVDNTNSPATSSPQPTEPDFSPLELSGKGINVTKSFGLPRGKYEIAYKFSNNISAFSGNGTNFISDIVCDESSIGLFSLTNLIDKSGEGTKIIEIPNNDSCYFEVEEASKSAKWTFTVKKR
jgi:hypothetical protein